MDIFGTAAKARVKALEEALAAERKHVEKLTDQLIALSDLKVHQALNPIPVEEQIRRQALRLEAQKPDPMRLRRFGADRTVREYRDSLKDSGKGDSAA